MKLPFLIQQAVATLDTIIAAKRRAAYQIWSARMIGTGNAYKAQLYYDHWKQIHKDLNKLIEDMRKDIQL